MNWCARVWKDTDIIQCKWVLLDIHLLYFKGREDVRWIVPLVLTHFMQVLFDILPLRLVPPFVYGGIIYGLVGLVPTVPAFWKFMLTLVLFNLTTASVILLLSISFESTGVGSLVGTLIMLFK